MISTLPAVAVVTAAALYSLALCFLNTHVTGAAGKLFPIVDGAITLAALGLAVAAHGRRAWFALFVLALNFLILALATGQFDPKSMRDLLALLAFLGIGAAARDSLKTAKIAFYAISACVVALALFEFLAPALYVKVFDVLDFYMARGIVDQQQAQYVDTSLFVSATRGTERTLLPALGAHRVSSIFLEPVSMGNFGAIAAAWCLSLDRRHRVTAISAGLVAAFCIVMADARFASMAVLFFIAARFAPLRIVTPAVAAMPIVTIGFLVLFGLYSGYGEGDDLPTRLAISGRALAALSAQDWLGAGSHIMQTLDSGYYYAIKSFGVALCALLWIAFSALPTPGAQSARMKLLMALYICTLLCVSGSSLFAIKTAAFAWLALGATIAEDAALQPARVVRDLRRAFPEGAPAR